METIGEERRPYTLDRTVRLIITIIILVGAFILIDYLKGVLLPFLVACVLAYVVHPIVEFNARIFRMKGKVMPVIVTLLEITALVTLFCTYVLPYMFKEMAEMTKMLGNYARSNIDASSFSAAVRDFFIAHFDVDNLSKYVDQQKVIKIIGRSLAEVWSFMGNSIAVIMSILSWLVVLLYFVFILIDYNVIMSGFRSIIPEKYRKGALKVAGDIQNTMSHYFRGQALVSLIVGVIFSIGFLIVGLPMAILFGLFIGLLNMVPYLQLISIPIAAILCLVLSVNTGESFWVIFGETIAVYCVCQLIQDFILVPKIMGKSMGLNPAIVFLSLAVWGALLGFIGLIIALPLTALIISYYKRHVLKKKDKPENAKEVKAEEIEKKE